MKSNSFLQGLYSYVKSYITVPVKLIWIGMALLLFSFVSRHTDPLVRIVTVLQKWTGTIPQDFWEPNITTDQNGKAKVYFYTSDIKSKYTIKILSVDITGAIGDGSFKI